MLEDIRWLQTELVRLAGLSKKIKTKQVSQKSITEPARCLVDTYFRSKRHLLASSQSHTECVSSIDSLMHSLLEVTHKNIRLVRFKGILGKIKKTLIEAEKLSLPDIKVANQTINLNNNDRSIIDTLKTVSPSAALSYEQATIDMASGERLSWRGPATDYREALRECLDALAPDNNVQSEEGFRLEPNTTGPTMKQKAQYILKKRQQPRNAIKPVQDAINLIEHYLSVLVRSVYTRANISIHTATGKSEVVRVRDQTRTVLCELLEIMPT